jgi:truncated hemoglobin YjbI
LAGVQRDFCSCPGWTRDEEVEVSAVDLGPWILLLVLFGGLLIAGWCHADRLDRSPGLRRAGATAYAPAAARRPPVVEVPAGDLPIGPPMVRMQTASGAVATTVPLRDWLLHFHVENANIWSDIVTEFYAAVMADPTIADYFRDTDRPALQKHFLAVVIAVTGDGVSTEMLHRMRARHAVVRNGGGDPISRPVFDAVAGLLTDVLAARGVPARTLCQVNLILAELQTAIVPDVVRGRSAAVA